VSPFVTAVGGTRLALGNGNVRVCETVWNGGTSGSTPFVAAATALVDGSQAAAGHPRIGLANGWFYQAASHPGTFFDITTGNNDLGGVGCCQATVGYDLASGLGVPDWALLPAALPPPG
jgi:hypothetical protein